MVALVISFAGVVGIMKTQSKALVDSKNAYNQIQAYAITETIVERLRFNNEITASTPGDYNFNTDQSSVSVACEAGQFCTPDNLVAYDLHWLKGQFTNLTGSTTFISALPDGGAEINWNALENRYEITVRWQEAEWQTANTGKMQKSFQEQQTVVFFTP